MKKFITGTMLIFISYFCFCMIIREVNPSTGPLKPSPFPFEYYTRTGESYDLNFTVVLLDEEAYTEAKRYYNMWGAYAFTISWVDRGTKDIYHVIMYVNKGSAHGEPYSSDFGHEIKHMIDNQEYFKSGQRYHRFNPDCRSWKECRTEECEK